MWFCCSLKLKTIQTKRGTNSNKQPHPSSQSVIRESNSPIALWQHTWVVWSRGARPFATGSATRSHTPNLPLNHTFLDRPLCFSSSGYPVFCGFVLKPTGNRCAIFYFILFFWGVPQKKPSHVLSSSFSPAFAQDVHGPCLPGYWSLYTLLSPRCCHQRLSRGHSVGKGTDIGHEFLVANFWNHLSGWWT